MSFSIGPELAVSFMLVFARVGTLLMLLPTLGERFFPVRARLLFALFLTLVLLPLVRPLFPADLSAVSVLTSLLAFEFLIGLMIGLTGRLLAASLQMAGHFVAQALGLAFAESIDPTQAGAQGAAIGSFLGLLGITLLFAADAHHLVIGAIHGSYDVVPPGLAPAMGDATQLALSTAAQAFRLAVQIAAPFIIFGIVFNVGLGVLSRLMPQLQVFFLGAPATILTGFLILVAVLGAMMGVYVEAMLLFLKGFAG